MSVWGSIHSVLIPVPHNHVVPLNISPAMAHHLAQLYSVGTAQGAARPLSSALPAWGGPALQHFGLALKVPYGALQPCPAEEGSGLAEAVAISILPQGWLGVGGKQWGRGRRHTALLGSEWCHSQDHPRAFGDGADGAQPQGTLTQSAGGVWDHQTLCPGWSPGADACQD